MREEFPWQPHRSEIDTNLNKVRALEGGEERARFRVSYSDIDVNSHATATTYLRWITDSYPLDAVSEMELRTLEISYLAEATLDDEISVTRESTIGEDICAIRRVQDSQDLCRAVLQWTSAS
jgi:acyl-ACP thioesterase